MKKILLIPVAAVIILLGAFLFSDLSAAKEEAAAMEKILRLHVRAADDSAEEQALKLQVRNAILTCTERILANCSDKNEAKKRIQSNLQTLEQAGQSVVYEEGKEHIVSVSLEREIFEYREYDGFFLPEGEYDSLIVNIGSGEGQNWWCVVFPAACYMGAAEIETDKTVMPQCFQLAKTRAENVTVKFWLWEKIKEIFS